MNIPNLKSKSHETREKSPESYFFRRAITHLKVGKTRQSLSWPVLRQGKFIYWVPNQFKSISQRTTESSLKQSRRTSSGRTDRRTDRLTEQRRGTIKSPGFTGWGLSALNPLKIDSCISTVSVQCGQGEQFRHICVFKLNRKWNTHKGKRQIYTGLNNPFHGIPEKRGGKL